MNVDVAPAEVSRFRSLLADRLGWTFDDNDASKLAQVLCRQAERLDMRTGEYLRRLGAGTDQSELGILAEELTITETHFFRHAEQFRALAEIALPERVRDRAGRRTVRMLSVGCSSGEEAYSLAIAARGVQPDPGWTISVLGLDTNPAVLRRAAAGRYSTWSLRETPDHVRQRWFRSHHGAFELDPSIRENVQFRQYNVADEDAALWHPGHYDVILCRNLLMYLTPATAQVLVHRMTRALAHGGYLFLGHTDSLGSRPDGLESRHSHGTFYYRRSADVASPAGRPHRLSAEEPPAAPPAPPHDDAGGNGAFRDEAVALLRDERFTEALAVVEAGLPDRPEPRDLLLHGVLLAQTGRIDDAEMVARGMLDVDGLYADAHYLLGVCLEGGAAVEVAIGHYRLAAYLDPEFAMPKLRLGLLARRRADPHTASTELDRALPLLTSEREERIVQFGGGFGRISLVALCRAELDATGAAR